MDVMKMRNYLKLHLDTYKIKNVLIKT